MLTLLMAACILVLPGKDGAPPPVDDSGPTACVELDCRDTLTLNIVSTTGRPSGWFAGTLSPPDASPVSFVCGAEASTFDGGVCNGDGSVSLWVYAESFSLSVDEGDDAAYYYGAVTPAWTAPYDSEACGHYCYVAEETVELVPCEMCG